jgi:hypothetical protein
MHTPYIQRMVNLESIDYRIVRRLAERKGLGRRGFSAALRLIVREWDYLTRDRASDSLRRVDAPSPIIRDWSRLAAEARAADTMPPDKGLKDLDLTIS